jgi:hypothetical protein
MKTTRTILVATILFVVALALLTGVEVNPVQAIYALPMLCVSCYLFRRVERESERMNEKTPSDSPVMGRTARYQDAA